MELLMKWYHYVWAPALITHLHQHMNSLSYGFDDATICERLNIMSEKYNLEKDLNQSIKKTIEKLPTYGQGTPLGYSCGHLEAIEDMVSYYRDMNNASDAMKRQIISLGNTIRKMSKSDAPIVKKVGGKRGRPRKHPVVS